MNYPNFDWFMICTVPISTHHLKRHKSFEFARKLTINCCPIYFTSLFYKDEKDRSLFTCWVVPSTYPKSFRNVECKNWQALKKQTGLGWTWCFWVQSLDPVHASFARLVSPFESFLEVSCPNGIKRNYMYCNSKTNVVMTTHSVM